MENSTSKPGPKPKNRTARQFSITLSPEMYDRLEAYMEENKSLLVKLGLTYNKDFNRSGVVAMLLDKALSL